MPCRIAARRSSLLHRSCPVQYQRHGKAAQLVEKVDVESHPAPAVQMLLAQVDGQRVDAGLLKELACRGRIGQGGIGRRFGVVQFSADSRHRLQFRLHRRTHRMRLADKIANLLHALARRQILLAEHHQVEAQPQSPLDPIQVRRFVEQQTGGHRQAAANLQPERGVGARRSCTRRWGCGK